MKNTWKWSYMDWFVQASFKASTGHIPANTSDFYTRNKSKLQKCIKSFILRWRTWTIVHKEVGLFSGSKMMFKKTGCQFYGYVMKYIPFKPESHAEQDGT